MSLVTIFITPKGFDREHIAVIQRNAVRSWKMLGEDVDILLIGDDEGVAENAQALGVRYGRAASARVRKGMSMLRSAANTLNVSTEEVVAKIEQNHAALSKAAKDIAEMKSKLALNAFDDVKKNAVIVGDTAVLTAQIPDANADTLRAMADKFKEEHPNAIGVFSTVANGQAVFIVNVSDELTKRGIKAGDIAKQISAVAGGSGGGRPTLAQAGGKIPEKIPESLDLALKLIREKLNR